MMKRVILFLMMASVSGIASAYEASGTVTFTNDYRFRGISQTGSDAAIQGSVDLVFDSGLYAGIWGSNVDFGDDANLEVDWYAGYGSKINDMLSWDATLYYYTYPGYDAADADFVELGLNLYYGGFKLGYNHSNDFFNTSKTSQYLSLDYSHKFDDTLSAGVHAGHSYGDYWDDLDIGDYSDFSISITKSIAGFDLSASYLFNDIDDGMKVNSGLFSNDNTLLFSLSRSF